MPLQPTKQQKCTHRNNYNSPKKCIFVAENKSVVEKYNPEIHKRRSVRLKDFDYSREGLYFITICCQNKEYFFGEITNEKMILNEIGQIVYTEWINTEKVRPNVKLHTFVVMPNHFHAIVEIVQQRRGVLHTPNNGEINDEKAVPHTPNGGKIDDGNVEKGVCNTPLQSPSQTLGAIVRGYKSAVSKKIGFSVWQRNYHEHIIRNQEAYFKIHQYIENNPAKWEEDCFYL